MKLKARIDNLEQVEEGLRQFYRPVDEAKSAFVVDIDPMGGWQLEDVGALKRSLENEKGRREQDRAAIESWAKLGMTAEQAAAAIAQRDELLKIDPEKKADALAEQKAEARVREVQTKAAEQATALEKELKLTRQYTERTLVQDVARRTIEDAKGSPELLMPVIERSVRVQWRDGVPSVQVLNAEGAPRIADVTTGKMLGIADYVNELKQDPRYQPAFLGSNAEGSGADTPKTTTPTTKVTTTASGTPRHRGDFSDNEKKGAWINQHGYDAFTKLPPPPTQGAGK